MPYVSPPRATFWQKLGPGGFVSLVLALLSGLLTLGLLLWFHWRKVLKAAKGDPLRGADVILVLGRRLEQDQITEVFQHRLEHAASLWLMGLAPRVIVAGGVTGKAIRSEAEDRSQDTLENLFNIREALRASAWTSVILVSDPLHLARALALSQGFGMDVTGSPAVECPPLRGSFQWWVRSLREAFLLHWYHTGIAYSRLLRSERQLSRVT
jgi:uncharacterized SAM-binding protein YcdF (DUF218 family)